MPVLTLSALGDIAMAVALPVVDRRRQPHVPTLQGLNDVRALLHSQKARRYPPYVLAALIAYTRRAVGGGKRAKATLEAELTLLESEFPEFAAEFRAVYKLRGIVRDPSLDGLRVSRCSCPRHRSAMRQRSGATPPPIYACDDPEPQATRELVTQIVRAAGVSSSLSAAAQDAEQALTALAPPTSKQQRRRTWGSW